MTDLASRHVASGVAERLDDERVAELAAQVPMWSIEGEALTRDVKVKNFRAALDLVNAIGEVAEEENHHPDLAIHGWNHVRIDLSTHSAKGLTENDFILAAKIDRLIPAR